MSRSNVESNPPRGETHFVVIYNRRAGRTEWRIRKRLARFFSRRNVSCELHAERALNWDTLKKSCAKKKTVRFVSVGGDGTLRRVYEALWKNDMLAHPVAFVPMGSGNIVAYSFRLPFVFEHALETAIKGTQVPIDLGVLNDKYVFFIGGGFGLLANNAVVLERTTKRRFGIFAYLFNLPSIMLRNYRAAEFNTRIETPDGLTLSERTHSIVVLNHLSFLGMGPRRSIAPDDGKLDIFVMRHATFLGLLRVAFDFYVGVGDSKYLRHVSTGSARCTLENFGGTMHLDGDPIFDTFTELEFKTLHKRASLIR